MPDVETIQSTLVTVLSKFVSEHWSEGLSKLWQFVSKGIFSRSDTGIYQVLEYTTTIELKDRKGKCAVVQKRERVCYLQNNVIAFHDQAWGDGKILENYRCTPGFPVDRYRSGYKTYILISLRGVKNRGEMDEFKMEWKIRDGFLKSTGFWATEISHHTDSIKINVIFPKSRPPLKASILEKNQQRTIILDKDSYKSLPDGRWEISWERSKPILYEQYLFNWVW